MDKQTEIIFKNLLGSLHKSVFMQRMYKKTGNNFRLFLPDGICKIINFQKSMFNSDGECKFTINVGIYFQKDLEKPNLRFKEYECQIRTRVSGISERYSGDHWWTINLTTDEDQLYSELRSLMEDDILPWLNHFTTRQDVIRMGQSGALQGKIWGNIYLWQRQ